jgi:hypothetical protein|tara:strand:+ start:49 stop:276 length:228 start_codon:yes stop_codon:yes gene_type:complete
VWGYTSVSSKKINKIYTFNEQSKVSSAIIKGFLVKTVIGNKVDNIDIYETIEEAESKLFEYLKRGTCCWIVNCNG